MTTDYRLPDNRLEGFIKWYAWSLHFQDCDPAIWMMNYLNKRFEHNSEQRIWLCWLYGNTYYLPTAWVLFNEFPDYELATVDRLDWWNTANYKRLRYQTDTKYNKGYLPAMFASYQNFIGPKKSQRDRLMDFCGDNEKQSFDNLWQIVNKYYYKFGRYTTWFYLQALKHTAGIPMQPTSLMLKDYEGSKSHRNGLCHALNNDNWVDAKLQAADYIFLEDCAEAIMQETIGQYPHLASEVDAFTLETALCAYKKLFRNYESRYLGYYLDRQAEEIAKVSHDDWWGIEWDVLWQARSETIDPRLLQPGCIQKEKYAEFYEFGYIDKLDWL